MGFTPDEEAVAGDAAIRVDLATLTGRADFTDLAKFPKGEIPSLGAGTLWLDGDLGYTITVGGNYLHSTGGDDGTVNGRFYGRAHEGVAGSVEREDLTATLGGLRE